MKPKTPFQYLMSFLSTAVRSVSQRFGSKNILTAKIFFTRNENIFVSLSDNGR